MNFCARNDPFGKLKVRINPGAKGKVKKCENFFGLAKKISAGFFYIIGVKWGRLSATGEKRKDVKLGCWGSEERVRRF